MCYKRDMSIEYGIMKRQAAARRRLETDAKKLEGQINSGMNKGSTPYLRVKWGDLDASGKLQARVSPRPSMEPSGGVIELGSDVAEPALSLAKTVLQVLGNAIISGGK